MQHEAGPEELGSPEVPFCFLFNRSLSKLNTGTKGTRIIKGSLGSLATDFSDTNSAACCDRKLKCQASAHTPDKYALKRITNAHCCEHSQ